jgi:hypothetical protein
MTVPPVEKTRAAEDGSPWHGEEEKTKPEDTGTFLRRNKPVARETAATVVMGPLP